MSKNKGSPLDYQNAGVYTSSLLDAYTDYKYLWTKIHACKFSWSTVARVPLEVHATSNMKSAQRPLTSSVH